jgi:predicted  nucleic acid-binding Zn-ribbon protein
VSEMTDLQEGLTRIQTKMVETRTQMTVFQQERQRQIKEVLQARHRITTIETLIEDLQVRQRTDMQGLSDQIIELKGCIDEISSS